MSNFEKQKNKKNRQEQLLREYTDLMEKYQRVTNKVRALERRNIPGTQDATLSFEIQETDEERHNTHLRLVEIAKQFGKTQQDVLVDIIRYENTLSEYGLPEFSILKSSDVVETGDFHSATQFNIDDDTGKPASPNPLDKPFGNYEFGRETYGGVAERIFPEDKILLVFSINQIEGYGDEEIEPEDFKERERRAEALAEEIHGEYFDNFQGGYHAASAHIIGVVFPISDLEKVANVIRNNPSKFRLGEEYY